MNTDDKRTTFSNHVHLLNMYLSLRYEEHPLYHMFLLSEGIHISGEILPINSRPIQYIHRG